MTNTQAELKTLKKEIKNTNKELKKLRTNLIEIKNELKNNRLSYSEAICNSTNLIIDYMNETQDRSLEEFSNKFFQEDLLEEYVKYRFEKFGADEVIRQLQGIPYGAERYYADGYDNLCAVNDKRDIIDNIDNAIYEIEYKIKK